MKRLVFALSVLLVPNTLSAASEAPIKTTEAFEIPPPPPGEYHSTSMMPRYGHSMHRDGPRMTSPGFMPSGTESAPPVVPEAQTAGTIGVPAWGLPATAGPNAPPPMSGGIVQGPEGQPIPPGWQPDYGPWGTPNYGPWDVYGPEPAYYPYYYGPEYYGPYPNYGPWGYDRPWGYAPWEGYYGPYGGGPGYYGP